MCMNCRQVWLILSDRHQALSFDVVAYSAVMRWRPTTHLPRWQWKSITAACTGCENAPANRCWNIPSPANVSNALQVDHGIWRCQIEAGLIFMLQETHRIGSLPCCGALFGDEAIVNCYNMLCATITNFFDLQHVMCNHNDLF